MLLETSSQSKLACAIDNVLRKNFLEQRSITWKPIRVELLVNSQLTTDFFGNYLLARDELSADQGHLLFLLDFHGGSTRLSVSPLFF